MYVPNLTWDNRTNQTEENLKIELYMIEKYGLFLDTIFFTNIVSGKGKIVILTNPCNG